MINDLRIFKEMVKERWGYETPEQLIVIFTRRLNHLHLQYLLFIGLFI